WETCISTGNHVLEERVGNPDNLNFSLAKTVIGASGIAMSDVSGTKQTLPGGSLAIICEGNGKAYWRGWGPVSEIGGSDPGGQLAPPPVAPLNPAASIVTETPASRVLLCRFDEMTGTVATDAT